MGKRDKYAKAVAKSASTPTVGGKPVGTTSTLAEVSQLKEALGQCMQQLQQLQSSVTQGDCLYSCLLLLLLLILMLLVCRMCLECHLPGTRR